MSDTNEITEGGKRSTWMDLVARTREANPGKNLSAVLKIASKTYKKSSKKSSKKTSKKSKRGGAMNPAPLTGGGEMEGMASGPAATGGRRRRGSRKSRGTRRR